MGSEEPGMVFSGDGGLVDRGAVGFCEVVVGE